MKEKEKGGEEESQSSGTTQRGKNKNEIRILDGTKK